MVGRRPRRSRGFTLVELVAVVVMVSVLSVVAFVSYRRYVGTARTSEATHMTNVIRQAQEAYLSETGAYASVSSNLQSYYPALHPGQFVTAWGGPCLGCGDPNAWNQIAVKSDSPVMFGYATIAGVGGAAAAVAAGSVATPGMITPAVVIASTDPFYVVMAYGDTNGDGVPCTVLAYSFDNNLTVTAEGE